jgi:DnaJ-domain-containing protein 1
MQIPGRLKITTLGDVLGSLHREQANGTLELIESNGRTHRVHLSNGLVTAVEVDRAAASLGEILRAEEAVDDDVLRRSLLRAMASRRLHGEVLVRDFHLSPEVVGRALRRQLMVRLAMLEEIADAQILFRVTMRPPRGALLDEPLSANEFLAGKKRTRDRSQSSHGRTYGSGNAPPFESGTHRTARPSSGFPGSVDVARIVAYRTLGVTTNAPTDEIKRAYRHLVRKFHPDLHPEATSDERRILATRFAEVTAAYRSLVA